jgi:hypothetical protein
MTKIVYQVATLDEPRPWGRIYRTRTAAFAAMRRHNALDRAHGHPSRPWPVFLRKVALHKEAK